MSPTNSSCSGLLSASLDEASLHLRAMRNTDSPLLGLLGTPFERALLHLCTMRDTDSSLFGLIGTSPVTALLHLGAVRDTNSSCSGLLSASPVTASFVLTAVRDTISTRNDAIGTPFEAAPFPVHFCMRDAYSFLHGSISAPHRPAFCFTSFFIRYNQRPTVAFFHLRLLLHMLRFLLDDDAFVDNSSTSTGRHGVDKGGDVSLTR